MATAIDVNVTLKGKLFTKKIDDVVKRAIVEEVLVKVDERFGRARQGRGLGAQRNTITRQRRGLELEVRSTRVWPRTKGTAWTRKNIGTIKSMSGRVARKAATRIVEELG